MTNRPICGGQTVSLQALCFRGLWEVEMKEVFFRSFGTKLLSLVRGDRPRPSLLAQPLLFMLFNPPYKHVSSHVHTHTTNSYSLHTHLPRRRCLLPATPLPRRRFNTRDPNSG